ncbi:hypothetical protein [Candidatus Palauibacter sp.]|uniref:hypothetical protein n=1 Tax=Candidatus Palauibacter sp. TaxID=3101350 RepID=UPI003D0ABE7B
MAVHAGSGRVHTIDLRDNGLTGSIPPEIGNFESLVNLFLISNDLTGSLPSELGELARLEYLDVSSNMLTGSLSSELGELARLEYLDVSSNMLTGSVLPELGGLASLEHLSLGDNELTGPIPPELGRLARLENLSLHSNELTGPIPPELGGLSRLENLSLHSNELTGPIPLEIGDLSLLRRLELQENDLAGAIPAEIGNAKRLIGLNVSVNPSLSGLMPRRLLNLRELLSLSTVGTRLCAPLDPGFRDWMDGISLVSVDECDAGVVERMALAELFNTTGGETWGNARGWNTDADLESWYGVAVEEGRVRSLLLADNGLRGSFPTAIVTLSELEQLDLSNNDLTGGLPVDVGYMSSLTTLLLTGNASLDGLLPGSMVRMTQLAVLQYGDTGLCIPPTRGFQTWVAGLDVLEGSFCTDAQRVTLEFPMVYLVQAIQQPGRTVPLVANRGALLRVFLTAPALHGFTAPPVLVTFHREGEPVYQVRIEAPSPELPVHVDEADLYGSYNAVIPAEHIQPGLEFFVDADPDGSLLLADDAEDRYPADGSVQLAVVQVPAMELTVVPVLNAAEPDSSIFQSVTDLTKDSHVVSMLRWAFPFSAFEARARETYITSLDLTTDAGQIGLLRELEAVRNSESGTGYWYGTALSKTGLVRGVAMLAGPISMGKPLAGELAHEVGHSLNLQHTPCGGAGGVDPSFPYRDGGIGAYGYDFREGVVVTPDARDVMGYCQSYAWLSDYHYQRVLAHHRAAARDVSNGSPQAEQLVLSGGVVEGDLTLDPPYRLPMATLTPSSTGPYLIEGSSGPDLRFSFRLTPREDKFGNKYFLLAVPVQRGEVDRIVLRGPEGEVVVDEHDARTVTIIRDESGLVRGMLRDWEGDIPAIPDQFGEVNLVSYRGLMEVSH